jgi:CDP-2,3-bis-(O-geranylgeranyl)-sn-glycerol synthase
MESVRLILATLYFFVPAYVANMAPVVAKGHLQGLDLPIDRGATFRGRRVLGDHKTWRGVATAVVGGAGAFALQAVVHELGWLQSLSLVDYADASPWLGVLLGVGAIVGDAIKSFAKRQVGIAPGEKWLVFDQLDFMAGAYLFAVAVYAPPLHLFLAILPVVFAGGVLTTSVGFRLGLKESWI